MKYVPPLGGNEGDPYVDGDPQAGQKGSIVPAAAIERPMREIDAAIAASGQTPDDGDLTQLAAAIRGGGGVYNVRNYGAVLDGATDDTDAINAAIDAANAAGGGTVLVDGDAHVSITSGAAITMKSNVRLEFRNDARVTLEPNNLDSYDIIRCHDIDNWAIIGAHVTGDLDGHTGGTGEHGMCVEIKGCTDFLIENCTFRKAWGDGIYLGASDSGGQSYSLRGRIVNVDCDGNRRQGMSIISCEDVEVIGGSYRNTSGTAPAAGIDVEPNNDTERVKGLRIIGARFEDNVGAGFLLSLQQFDGTTEPVDVTLTDCSATGNENDYELHAPGDSTNGSMKGRMHLVRPFSYLADKAGVLINQWDKDGMQCLVEEPVVIDPAEGGGTDASGAGISIVRSPGSDNRLGNITIVRPWIEDRRGTGKMQTCIYARDNEGSGNSGPIRIIDPLKLAGFTGAAPYTNYEGVEVIDPFRASVRDEDSGTTIDNFRYYPVIQNSTFTAQRTITLGAGLMVGTRIVFEITGSQDMLVAPQAGETILVLGTGAGASVALRQQGERVVLQKITSTLWMPVEISGMAAYDLIGVFGATPIVQPASANQAALTNNTGGSADGTLAAVSGSGADNVINDNFTELHVLLNEVRTVLVNLGWMKGSA